MGYFPYDRYDPMLNVGLTGGIASGKSTVDLMFLDKGAYLIDHDSLAHRVEEPGHPAWNDIVSFFGSGTLNEDRTINREKLGALVFKHESKRKMLNDIVHPAVFSEWMKEIEKITRKDPRGIIISDIPLLFEVGWQDAVDVIVLIYIPRDEQLRRLTERNGYSKRDAENRLNSQMSIDDKVLRSDYVINNEGPLDNTRENVDRVWTNLVEKERIKSMKSKFFKLKDRT
jgi:dephospho-CoA kinase